MKTFPLCTEVFRRITKQKPHAAMCSKYIMLINITAVFTKLPLRKFTLFSEEFLYASKSNFFRFMVALSPNGC